MERQFIVTTHLIKNKICFVLIQNGSICTSYFKSTSSLNNDSNKGAIKYSEILYKENIMVN